MPILHTVWHVENAIVLGRERDSRCSSVAGCFVLVYGELGIGQAISHCLLLLPGPLLCAGTALSFFLRGDPKVEAQTGSVSQLRSQNRAELMLQSGFLVKFTSHIVACFRPQLSRKPGLGEAGGWLRMGNWQETNCCQSEEQAGAGPSKQE